MRGARAPPTPAAQGRTARRRRGMAGCAAACHAEFPIDPRRREAPRELRRAAARWAGSEPLRAGSHQARVRPPSVPIGMPHALVVGSPRRDRGHPQGDVPPGLFCGGRLPRHRRRRCVSAHAQRSPWAHLHHGPPDGPCRLYCGIVGIVHPPSISGSRSYPSSSWADPLSCLPAARGRFPGTARRPRSNPSARRRPIRPPPSTRTGPSRSARCRSSGCSFLPSRPSVRRRRDRDGRAARSSCPAAHPDLFTGRSYAIAGIVCGSISVFLTVVFSSCSRSSTDAHHDCTCATRARGSRTCRTSPSPTRGIHSTFGFALERVLPDRRPRR